MKLYCFLHPHFAPARPEAAPGTGRAVGAWLWRSVLQTPLHPRAGPRPAPKPHGHGGNVDANARDGTRGAGNPHVKPWPFFRGQPCELYARWELGATSRALCCPGGSLSGFWGFSGFLQQMALFSSVSSPLLLEFSLGESVLKEPHWFPSLILHEASWTLVKGHWLWEGAGSGMRVLQGLGQPKWRAGHASAQIQLGFSFCSCISSTDPSRKRTWEPGSSSTFLISLIHSGEGEPFHILDPLLCCQSHPTLLVRAPSGCFSQLPQIMKKRWCQQPSLPVS